MRLVTDRNDLDDRIAQLDAEIAAHPMASRKMRAALAVIEEFNLGGVALVEQRLAEQCLPSLATLARIQEAHALSWYRLHEAREELRRENS